MYGIDIVKHWHWMVHIQ